MKYCVGQRFYLVNIDAYVSIELVYVSSNIHYHFRAMDNGHAGSLTETELTLAIWNGFIRIIKTEPLELLRYIKRLELI